MKIQIKLTTKIFPKELIETIDIVNPSESLSDTLKTITEGINKLVKSAGNKEVSEIKLKEG